MFFSERDPHLNAAELGHRLDFTDRFLFFMPLYGYFSYDVHWIIFWRCTCSLRHLYYCLSPLSLFWQTLETLLLFISLSQLVWISWQVIVLHHRCLSLLSLWQQTLETLVPFWTISVFVSPQVFLSPFLQFVPCSPLKDYNDHVLIQQVWCFFCLIHHLLGSIVIFNQPFSISFDIFPPFWFNTLIAFVFFLLSLYQAVASKKGSTYS